ncbi:MAG: tetratricopeptide repeat protein [Anaerolinea sp.]|nr:tetratricopeptide repeat protein [Anaerolinea sp.]
MRTDSILTYIPVDRRHSLAAGIPLPREVTGSVLFADISGFTPLTESLTRTLGARLGAEELTRQLNRVYDALTEEVERYGGAIITFGGDAMTCYFDGGAAPELGALRALTCAFALQTAMTAFKSVRLPNGETISLSIKVALASGRACRCLVGDPNILLMDVLAGETLVRMEEAAQHTVKGEIVMDLTTAELVSDACTIAEWRAAETTRFARVTELRRAAAPCAWSPLDARALPADQLRSWVMPALANRDDSLTELRPAVAFFLAFSGINYDTDPEAERKLDAFVRWIQAIIARYDGALLQVSMGDKGSSLYAAFGVPTAHENNAARAASAALETRTLPRELSYVYIHGIGITQGIMRAGTYGGRTRRTYGVIGDDVNLAARLMGHASPGQILVSDRVQKALAGSFDLRELTPIRVKGKQDALPVARLIGRRTDLDERSVSHERPLVGRQRELARLQADIAPILDHQPAGCTWVHGEAGIGKSHLIYAARQQVGDQVNWYTFATDQLVQESLHPVLPVLANFFNFDFAANEYMRKTLFDRRIDRLIKSLPDHPEAPAVAANLNAGRWYIGALLGLHWAGSPYESAESKTRFERSLAALNTLAHALSLIKPLVLHIQDAQWLDNDSLALLDLWIESASRFPIAVIIDSRDQYDEASLARPGFKALPIAELAAADVAELTANVLNGAVSDAAARYLYEKASGNPLFTEQLTLDLSERRALVPSLDGTWDLSDQPIDDMPANLNAVLIARLDRLIGELRAIVQVASVLGQEFDVPVLAHMLGGDADVKPKIKQAEDETIWIARSERQYVFRHALLRDAAYSMQAQERLRELHALAGAAIEQVYAENLLAKAPDLAFHYEKSAIYERAVIYLIKSAQSMAGLHANQEAIRFYLRALDLSAKTALPPAEIMPLHEGLGDLYDNASSYAESIAHYDRALDLVGADQVARRTALLRKKGYVLQKWGQFDEATACFEAGLVELQADLKPEEACQLYMGLSMINYRQGKVEDATELAQMGLAMAQMGTDKRSLAAANQTVGVIHWKKGEYAEATRLYAESLALWKESGNMLGLASIHNNLGLLHQSMGDLDQALAAFEQGSTLFDQVGNLHGLAVAYDNLGQVYRLRGDDERSFEYLEKAVTILAQIGLSDSEVFTSMWQSGTW